MRTGAIPEAAVTPGVVPPGPKRSPGAPPPETGPQAGGEGAPTPAAHGAVSPRQVARPRALKGVDPGRRWDSPSPLLGGAWPGRCSLRCLRRLRRPSSDSGSHAPHFIPVPGEQRWVYVFI